MNDHATTALPEFSHAGLHRNCPCAAFHRHSGCELILVLKGECTIETALGRRRVASGQVLVIPPGVPHNQINHSPEEMNLYCVFSAAPEFFDPSWRIIDVTSSPRPAALMSQLLNRSNSPAESAGLLCALLVRLTATEQSNRHADTLPPRLRQALACMERRFTSDLAIAEVAHSCGISPAGLRNLFRACLGQTPLQYLNNLRLARARQMLRDPEYSIKEIAAACGFSDPNYFTRLHRRYFGHAPSIDRDAPDARSIK